MLILTLSAAAVAGVWLIPVTERWKASVLGSQVRIPCVRLSVRPHGKTRLPLDGFSWSVTFEHFSKICRKKFKFPQHETKITGTLREDLCEFTTVSRWVLPKMRNVSDRSDGEIKHFVISFFSNRAVPDVIWKKYDKSRRGHGWQYNTAHALCTPAEYVILILHGDSS